MIHDRTIVINITKHRKFTCIFYLVIGFSKDWERRLLFTLGGIHFKGGGRLGADSRERKEGERDGGYLGGGQRGSGVLLKR